jgi:hypothetical protein
MQTLNDPGYIYIGAYFHHHGKDLSNLTEKKIGKSINIPLRENSLNSTKFTIGYTMLKYWYVENMSIVEKSLHAILPNRLNGEWFEDEDDTLVNRVSKYMTLIGGIEKNIDVTDLDPIAKNLIKSAKDRSRIIELAGQQFTYTRENITVTIEITNTGEFKCLQTNTIYNTPGAPFNELWKNKLTNLTYTINAWVTPKNDRGNSIDQELTLLPE